MKTEIKPITYKARQITLVRYSGKSARNGREYGVLWNAHVDGVPIMAYSVYFKRTALAAAKRVIDLAPDRRAGSSI